MSWKTAALGDVLTLKRGYDLPHDMRADGDIPVVSSSGITGYHKESKVKAPAVVTGRYGTLGEVFYVEQDCWPLNTALYVMDFKGNRPKYIYYFLQNLLKGMQSDKAAVPGVNRNDLHARLVTFASTDSLQKSVEDFLSPYDSLIESCQRRIFLLEESIRLLYREWFVFLRFPGHEHVEIHDGVPRGWRRLDIKDCCVKVSYGYTATASVEKIGPKFLRITDIVPDFIVWESVPQCEIDEKGKEKYKLSEGDIVVARTGATVGYAKLITGTEEDAVYASYLVRFKPDPNIIDSLILGTFMESKEYKDFVRSNAGGAAQPNANAQILGAAKLLVPTKEIQQLFRSYCEDSFKLRGNLIKQIAALKRSRDLLLPRLMNGDITV
ncbi:EcoKI restriction-modification system protein HsdS [compost metagenome]